MALLPVRFEISHSNRTYNRTIRTETKLFKNIIEKLIQQLFGILIITSRTCHVVLQMTKHTIQVPTSKFQNIETGIMLRNTSVV
jgi:hypothetical protein